MADSHSSISSSDPKSLPRAFLLALLLFLMLETGLRFVDPRHLIPYNENFPFEHYAVRYYLETAGPADISFIGSSRIREAVHLPTLADLLAGEEDLSRMSCANYGCSGASADVVEAVARLMMRQEKKPALIIYGVSPKQYLGRESNLDVCSVYWNFGDWYRARSLHGEKAAKYFPDVFRTAIGRASLVFRYRKRPGDLASRLLSKKQVLTCPIRGEPSAWHTKLAGRNMRTTPTTPDKVREHLEYYLVDGEYPMSEEKLKCVQNVIDLCQSNGIPVVLLEVPVADILLEHYPPGTQEKFLEMTQRLSVQNNVPFFRSAEIGAVLSDESFSEESHLGVKGAVVYTKAVYQTVIRPRLKPVASGP